MPDIFIDQVLSWKVLDLSWLWSSLQDGKYSRDDDDDEDDSDDDNDDDDGDDRDDDNDDDDDEDDVA